MKKKLKRKVVIIRRKKVAPESSKESDVRLFSKEAAAFYDKVRNAKGVNSLQKYLKDMFEKVTGEQVPSSVPLVLVKRRIAYELLAQPYTEAEMALPSVLKVQLSKSRKMSYNAWDNNEVEMARLSGAALGIEETFEMVKAAAKEKAPKAHTGKSSGKNVQEWYKDVMDKQSEKKLTDEELAAACNKEFPNANEREPEYFAHIRGVYNLGKIPPQAGKAPKCPVPVFEKLKGKRTAMLFRGKGCVEKNAAVAKAYTVCEKAPEKEAPAPKKVKAKPAPKAKKVVKKAVKKTVKKVVKKVKKK